MARIKCPNCNIDIGDELKSCPFCGTQLTAPNIVNNNVNPKWMDQWKIRLMLLRILSVVIFISFNVIAVILIRNFYDATIKGVAGLLVTLSFVFLYIFIVSIFKHQIDIKDFDGYSVLVYQGIFGYLVVEDKIVAKKFMGLLPVVNKDTILDPSTVCLFLNLNVPEIDDVSARSLRESKDLLTRLPNNKKVLAHYDGKKYVLMHQVSDQ